MKNLVKKEFVLTACPLTYFFIAFALMTMIPGYPIVMGAFFVCLGILYTYQFAREFNDITYSALLPVSKADIVKSKFVFVVFIEMASFAIMAGLTAVRMLVLSDAEPYANNVLMNANLAFLGYALIVFALFNVLFVQGFFKTAYRYGKPFVLFIVAALLVMGIGETLIHIPGLESLGSTVCAPSQLVVLALGVVAFAAGTLAALKRSIASFELIDL